MYSLPEALAPLGAWRQFILVRLVPKRAPDGQPIPGKTEKFPTHPTLHTACDAHDPSVWLDWHTAATLAASMPVTSDTLGWCIGFVLTSADPFGCLDLDNCLQVDGTWSPQALAMLAALPGATEVSLSGRGLHQWICYTGPAPEHAKRRGGMEFYTEKRFIALGHAANGQMLDVTGVLPTFVADWFPATAGEHGDGWTTGPCEGHTVLTDDELLTRAMADERKNNPAAAFGDGVPLPCFRDLWTRDLSILCAAYPTDQIGKEYDYSEADWALAKELAYWTGRDCARIERLMRQSALMRDKWDERRRDDTFLSLTIKRGVAGQPNVYKARTGAVSLPAPAAAGRLTPTPIAQDETYVAREGLAELFKDCVYIQDVNSILLPNGDIVDQGRFNARYGGYAFGMDANCEKTSKSAWDAFLNNSVIRFPRVEGTEFNPRLDFQQVVERAERAWVNVYKRPVVARRPGDVQPFMDLLHRILPNGDDALILLSYMAAVCQYPGVKFRWAPFIQGTRGNGKSTLVECLKHALGHKYVFTLKAGMIENGFNAWLENNILYVADDIYSTRDRTDMMEALKSLITGRDHAITLKGIDSILKRICGNFIFMDNHKDAMKKQEDTRDMCTLYCAQQSKADRLRDGLTKEYFQQLYTWLDAGGYEFVAEYLHTLQIDARYNPAGECQEAPDTSATHAAVIDGRTGLEQDVAELIEMQEPGFAGNFVSYHMLKQRMLEMPQYRKSLSLLKAGELLGRLGYEQHRALAQGRLPEWVRPDQTQPIVFVKRDTMQAGLTDPAIISALYVQAQNQAQTRQNERKFS